MNGLGEVNGNRVAGLRVDRGRTRPRLRQRKDLRCASGVRKREGNARDRKHCIVDRCDRPIEIVALDGLVELERNRITVLSMDCGRTASRLDKLEINCHRGALLVRKVKVQQEVGAGVLPAPKSQFRRLPTSRIEGAGVLRDAMLLRERGRDHARDARVDPSQGLGAERPQRSVVHERRVVEQRRT